MKGSGRGCGDTVQGRARGVIIKKFFFLVRVLRSLQKPRKERECLIWSDARCSASYW